MIYFARSPAGAIKIGSTGDLRRRLKELAHEFHCQFEVLAIADGNNHEEKVLHAKFSHLRIEREFFEPTDDLLGYIEENARSWDGIEDDWRPRQRPMEPGSVAMGDILVQNLCRLGYCEQVVRTTEIARLVSERTGKTMSRQRIANLLNAAHITDSTLAIIAEALGVDPSELLKRHSGH